MAAREARVLTGHDEIRKWVEERGGRPAAVPGTGQGDARDVLQIDFPGFGSELQQISWEEWFEMFDQESLAFLCQNLTKDGNTSRFFKLINRAQKVRKAV